MNQKDCKLPPIPDKKYFTIGEASDLCGVKPHVLRYWEQEFPQLKPTTRRGNRRYYQHRDVLLIRQIRSLLYEECFTISGARQQIATFKPRSVAAHVIVEDQQATLSAICTEIEEIIDELTAAA
jgi:DNA-binding transcriptional MerR regulator